jgi:hypothetical protein
MTEDCSPGEEEGALAWLGTHCWGAKLRYATHAALPISCSSPPSVTSGQLWLILAGVDVRQGNRQSCAGPIRGQGQPERLTVCITDCCDFVVFLTVDAHSFTPPVAVLLLFRATVSLAVAAGESSGHPPSQSQMQPTGMLEVPASLSSLPHSLRPSIGPSLERIEFILCPSQ